MLIETIKKHQRIVDNFPDQLSLEVLYIRSTLERYLGMEIRVLLSEKEQDLSKQLENELMVGYDAYLKRKTACTSEELIQRLLERILDPENRHHGTGGHRVSSTLLRKGQNFLKIKVDRYEHVCATEYEQLALMVRNEFYRIYPEGERLLY